MPYLITCPIENVGNRIPIAISLTEKPCAYAENKLKVINNLPVDGIKKAFGVCCKYLFFDKRSQATKFIEWIHLLRILGADKVTLFNRQVHKDHYQILNYFQDKGYIDFYDYLEPSGLTFEKEFKKVIQKI